MPPPCPLCGRPWEGPTPCCGPCRAYALRVAIVLLPDGHPLPALETADEVDAWHALGRPFTAPALLTPPAGARMLTLCLLPPTGPPSGTRNHSAKLLPRSELRRCNPRRASLMIHQFHEAIR